MRRCEASWEVLSTGPAFWETLGLAPISGPKNVIGYCVFPFSEDILDTVDAFLKSIGAAYESSRLGNHFRARDVGGFFAGLVPAKASDPLTPLSMMTGIWNVCIQLGAALADQHDEANTHDKSDATVVVYLVNPFSNSRSIGFLCHAFWALFQEYTRKLKESRSRGRRRDIVLQLMPIGTLASLDTVAVPESEKLSRLSREVYDRCPPSQIPDDVSVLKIFTAASIYLKEPAPRQIPFRLTNEPSQNLLYESSHLHVAYACSTDKKWLTAVWTDGAGQYQTNLSYSLVGERAFDGVAQEIWATCLDIMRSRRVTWRVVLARVGLMEREEMNGEI